MAKGYVPEKRYYVSIHEKGVEESLYIQHVEGSLSAMVPDFINATHFRTLEEIKPIVASMKTFSPVRTANKNFVARTVIVAVDGFDVGVII